MYQVAHPAPAAENRIAWLGGSDNRVRSVLYLFLTVSAAIILLLPGCICYQFRVRRKERKLSNKQTVCIHASSPSSRSPMEFGSLLGSQNTSPCNEPLVSPSRF